MGVSTLTLTSQEVVELVAKLQLVEVVIDEYLNQCYGVFVAN